MLRDTHVRELVDLLRKGKAISFLDSTIVFEDGRFRETSLGYDADMGHCFGSTRMSFREVLKALKSGKYH